MILSYLTILSTILATTNAGEWPSWRGPARDDVSMETSSRAGPRQLGHSPAFVVARIVERIVR